jgi:hypothetical protein
VTTATPVRSQQRPVQQEEIERMKREKDEQAKEALRPKKDDRARPADPAKRGPGTGT